VILSVILAPLVQKAVFVAIYGFVAEMALTKLTFPFRKVLKLLQISLLQRIEPLERNTRAYKTDRSIRICYICYLPKIWPRNQP